MKASTIFSDSLTELSLVRSWREDEDGEDQIRRDTGDEVTKKQKPRITGRFHTARGERDDQTR